VVRRIPTMAKIKVLLFIQFFFKDTKYIIIPNLLEIKPFGVGFLFRNGRLKQWEKYSCWFGLLG
jgi:hypothetical protein